MDFAIAVLLEERLARTSGERISLDDLAAGLGLGDFLTKERARRATDARARLRARLREQS